MRECKDGTIIQNGAEMERRTFKKWMKIDEEDPVAFK